MDVLSEILAVTGVGNALMGVRTMLAPWGASVDPGYQLSLHAIRSGTCWLRVQDEAPRQLVQGDVLLVGAGQPHALMDSPERTARPYSEVIAEMAERERQATPKQLAAGCRLLCAKYAFHESGVHPLLSALPKLLHLSASPGAEQRQIQPLLSILEAEATEPGVGSQLLIPRLVDSLVVLVLRAGMSDSKSGWPVALRDPGIGMALRLIHEQPSFPWTVEALAKGAAKSRATFARRFVELVGETPAAYLARWRMCLASKALRDSGRTLDEIAAAVGYETGTALAKAFKRHFGASPAQWRRDHARAEGARPLSRSPVPVDPVAMH